MGSEYGFVSGIASRSSILFANNYRWFEIEESCSSKSSILSIRARCSLLATVCWLLKDSTLPLRVVCPVAKDFTQPRRASCPAANRSSLSVERDMISV